MDHNSTVLPPCPTRATFQRSESSEMVDGEQLPVHSRRCQARDVSDALVVRVDNLRERQTWLLIVQCRKPYGVEWQGPKWLTEKR